MIRRLRVEVTHAEARYALAKGGPLEIGRHGQPGSPRTRHQRLWESPHLRALPHGRTTARGHQLPAMCDGVADETRHAQRPPPEKRSSAPRSPASPAPNVSQRPRRVGRARYAPGQDTREHVSAGQEHIRQPSPERECRFESCPGARLRGHECEHSYNLGPIERQVCDLRQRGSVPRSDVQYVPGFHRLIREFPCSATARIHGLRAVGCSPGTRFMGPR